MPLDLIVGPAKSGKKNEIIQRCVSCMETGLNEPFLIVPTETDASAMRSELLKSIDVAIGADVITFGGFLHRLAGKAGITQLRIDDTQRDLIIRQVVEGTKLTALAESSRYPGFRKALALFLAELEQGMNMPEALESAFDNWAQDSFRSADYLSDILGLYRAYRDKLESLGVIDSGLVGFEVVKALEAGEIHEKRPIFIHGFDDFTASQARIIDLLSANEDTQVTLTLTFDDIEAFAGLKQSVEQLIEIADNVAWTAREYDELANSAQGAMPADIGFLVSAGDRAEVELVGAKILELVRSGDARPDEIAVILREPARYARIISQVFENFDIPFSLNEPVAFTSSALGRAVMALLGFCLTSQEIHDFTSYLRIRHPGKQKEIDSFEREARLKSIGGANRLLDLWARVSGDDAAEVRALFDASSGAFANFARHIRVIALDLLDVTLASTAAFSRLEQTINSFMSYSRFCPEHALRSHELLDALEGAEIRIGKEAEAGKVHILRVHRARGRSYKYVFILGLNEGYFPKATREDSFLNEEERKQLSLLGLELKTTGGDVSEERYLFYIATTRAAEGLFLSYQSANSDGKALLKSSFVHDLQEAMGVDEVAGVTTKRAISDVLFNGRFAPMPSAEEAVRHAASIYNADSSVALRIAGAAGQIETLECAVVNTFNPVAGFATPKLKEFIAGKDVFNITELERFLNCPFQWYVERLLNPQKVEQELDRLSSGSILHSTLEEFYRALPERFGVCRPAKEHLADMEKLALEVFDAVFKREAAETGSIDARFVYHELAGNLKRFIRAEAVRVSDFIPALFEATFGLPAEAYDNEHKEGYMVLGDGVRIRGRIDRIDIDNESNAIIIDYKMKNISTIKDIENGKNLQIPLYIEAVKQLWDLNPVAGAYLSINKGVADGLYNLDYTGKTALPAKSGKSGEEFNNLLASAMEKARGVVAAISQGRFDPSKDADCRQCGLKHICRKGGA